MSLSKYVANVSLGNVVKPMVRVLMLSLKLFEILDLNSCQVMPCVIRVRDVLL